MTRLDLLVGIGLMLAGSLAYALPPTHEYSALYMAFGGIGIASGGFVARNHESLTTQMRYMNAGVAAFRLDCRTRTMCLPPRGREPGDRHEAFVGCPVPVQVARGLRMPPRLGFHQAYPVPGLW